ncbi:hypothetical protein SSX86_021583 [Deinandra increscens subsp. villosa]|uniref:Scarecrow-like protein 6 n=1 Tax=Deinandra increscens subsp. villosa TaxID=3103831 RepID=A0AAP0GTY3_9ASTR
MKGAPLPFEFQSKGVTGAAAAEEEEFILPCANQAVRYYSQQDWVNKKRKCIEEPKSVLDNVNSSPSPPTSTSTLLSSSLGGGGGGGGGLAAVLSAAKWENQETRSSQKVGAFDEHRLTTEEEDDLNITGDGEKCGEMDDWESVMSESGQEQSILRWIMGDGEDPSSISMVGGFNKMLHDGTGFGVLDQGFLGFDSSSNLTIGNYNLLHHQPPPDPFVSRFNPSQMDVKPNLLINQNQSQPHQNPAFFVPLEHQTLNPPPPKRYKTPPFLDEPDYHQQQQQQGIIDQLFKAADTIQSRNNPLLAQSILARLNHHQLSPIGKPPFQRAAFYFKEALHLLIHSILNTMMNPITSSSLIFKIGAYKSFSEVSPLVQFTNFTCNQALLEVLDGFDHVHIIDFDIRYGDQWASFMQELALRTPLSLKITTFASPTNDHLELSLTRDNLIHFASEMNIAFDFEILSIDVLASSVSWSLPFRASASDNEAIAVNLPISTVTNYQIPLSLVLRFIKNLSPKIVVSVDRGCERTDLPFPDHLIHALQSFSNLLESLDAVNMNPDTSQKIERFLIQPSVEKIITGRFSFPEKTQHWRSQFLSTGFSPLTFSNFAESQALCVIKRTPIRGFHIERRQSALVLCWEHRELVSASAWRC